MREHLKGSGSSCPPPPGPRHTHTHTSPAGSLLPTGSSALPAHLNLEGGLGAYLSLPLQEQSTYLKQRESECTAAGPVSRQKPAVSAVTYSEAPLSQEVRARQGWTHSIFNLPIASGDHPLWPTWDGPGLALGF